MKKKGISLFFSIRKKFGIAILKLQSLALSIISILCLKHTEFISQLGLVLLKEVPTGKGDSDENCVDSHENSRDTDRDDFSRDHAVLPNGGLHGFTHGGSEGESLEDKEA